MIEVGEQLTWFCTYCNRGSAKIHKVLKKLESANTDLSTRQPVLGTKYEDIAGNLVESLEKYKDFEKKTWCDRSANTI